MIHDAVSKPWRLNAAVVATDSRINWSGQGFGRFDVKLSMRKVLLRGSGANDGRGSGSSEL
jgi:hypothetical protein